MILAVLSLVLGVWILAHPRRPLRTDPTVQPEQPRIDLALVCDLLCVALKSGASLPKACETVGTAVGSGHGPVLQRAARALALGASWEEAWGAHTLGTILEPAWADGADPTPLLEQLARSIRARRSATAKEAAAKLAVQLVLPVGLCLLPAFILVGVVPLLINGSLRILG